MSEIERQVNRSILRSAVMQQMFCPLCMTVLDVDRAVHAAAKPDAPVQRGGVCCADCFDKQVARAGPPPAWLEVIDGREYKEEA